MGETADTLRPNDDSLAVDPDVLPGPTGPLGVPSTTAGTLGTPGAYDLSATTMGASATSGAYELSAGMEDTPVASGAYDLSATTDDTGGADTDEAAALRTEIEQTRNEMSATIDAIQEKLNPQNIVDQAKETVREATVGRVEQMVSNATDTARETGSSVMDMIQQNPLPAAIVGLGLGWLLMRNGGGSNNQPTYRPSSGTGDGRAYNARYAGQSDDWNRQVRYYGDNPNQGQNPIGQVVDTIRQNPIPAALAGLGAWMLMNRSGDSSHTPTQGRYPAAYRGYQEPGPLDQAQQKAGQVVDQARDTVGSAAEQARDTAGQVVGTVQDTAGQVAGTVADTVGQVAGTVTGTAGQIAGTVQDRVGDVADLTQYGAYQAKNQLQRMLEDNPLMVGVMAAAVGVAVGLALPETPQEHQLMGQMRDNLMDKAQEAAQNTMQKVQQVATEAQQTVREEAQSQGLTQ